MPDASPWDEIEIPGADYNVRQVAGSTAVPCFWGRDTEGCYLFIVELAGDHSTQFRKSVTNVKGIRVDLRQGCTTGVQRFVLTLEQQVDRDLFEGLCRTLVFALGLATDSSSSLAIALTHIRRWKSFLAGRVAHHLSPDEIRGLFAELTFLLELLEHASSDMALAAWLGPERSHQDFIFGNTAVEIKSVSGVERSTVHISSEDQLESLNDFLFLRIYRLSDLPEAAHAASLNEVVVAVLDRLTEPNVIDDFERKLVAHGYAPLPEYDQPRLVATDTKTYRVIDGFPYIVRAELPSGVCKVRYDLKLEAIATFQCGNDDVWGGNGTVS